MENRKTFFARLRPVVPPAELRYVELAYTIAKDAHRPQVRKETGDDGRPLRYFEHPRRVALVLIDTARITDWVVLSAALLHDAYEDTRYVDPAFLEQFWGADVARLVQLVSKKPKEGYLERLAAYGDWRALLVKAADRLDNVRSLDVPEVSPEFRARQIAETRDHYLPLFDRLLELAPDHVRPGAAAITAEIRERVGAAA